MANRWAKNTPDDFRFTAKFPKAVTHYTRMGNVAGDLDYFYKAMVPVAKKLVCLLIQLPPKMTLKESLN
jgi:uncharacterized protein YecE (DUF72 family)